MMHTRQTLRGRRMARLQHSLKWLVLLGALPVLSITSLGQAQGIARGYTTQDTGLVPGMVASIQDNTDSNNPEVERAQPSTTTQAIGVVTAPQNNLVTIASANEQVYVQTTGVVPAYVSDINGKIKKNSLLAVSPLKGILMLADSTTAPLALALQDFSTDGAQTQTITTTTGTKTVHVAEISISLDVHGQLTSTVQEAELQQIGRAIVGKDVGEVQALVGLAIFLIVLTAEGGIIYGAVSSAITSLGRNPLAKGIIKRELVRVLLIAIAVLLIGLAAIYAILEI